MRIVGNPPSGGKKPTTPTIGTATAGNASATVAYTPSTYIGKGTITYTATSTPGSFTGTGASPITVSGLTNGTAYTFKVSGTTNYGVASDASAASNSITPTVPKPTVTGGTLTSDATYYYRAFTSSGNLTVSGASLTADVLIVAGGANGGGGIYNQNACGFRLWIIGSGGGAGGLISASSSTITPSTLTVTVGAGGGGTGSNSSVTGYTTALGGGTGSGSGGRYFQNYCSNTRVAPGNGTAGQGNRGGNTCGTNSRTSQGGGGAGAQGIDFATQTRPDGGIGSSAFSSWGAVTGLGQNVCGTRYFAGGGGGYSGVGAGAGLGGSGGGTAGAQSASSSNSPANTGGGSGGVSVGFGGPNLCAGNGGSGVVIFRYTKAQVD